MEPPHVVYDWIIKDSTLQEIKQNPGDSVESPVFSLNGLKWYLQFYANYYHEQKAYLFLRSACLPPNVSSVSVRMTLKIKETNTKCNTAFSYKEDDQSFGFAESSAPKTALITKLSQITLSASISLIDVYDTKQKNITSSYMTTTEQKMDNSPQSAPINNEQLQMHSIRLDSITTQIENMTKNISTIQNTLKDIQLQIKEEKKENDGDLRKEIDELKKNMKMLLSKYVNNNGDDMDKDKKAFKKWIEIKIKLPQYYDVFVENGIETLNVVQLMTKQELNEMGITKIGHKMQILKEIQKLQQNANDKPAEGGTAYI